MVCPTEEVEKALKGIEKIKENQVECHPYLVPYVCIDYTVDIKFVRKFFPADGWQAVDNVVRSRRR